MDIASSSEFDDANGATDLKIFPDDINDPYDGERMVNVWANSKEPGKPGTREIMGIPLCRAIEIDAEFVLSGEEEDDQMVSVRGILMVPGEEDMEVVAGLPLDRIDELGAEIAWKEEDVE